MGPVKLYAELCDNLTGFTVDPVHVVEEQEKRLVPGRDGPKTVLDVRRIVNAAKLRCAYVDAEGNLKIRWQENAPSIDKESLPQ